MINLIKKMKKFLLLLYFIIQITCGNPNDDRNDFEIAREIGGCTQKILIECGNKTPEKCSAICKQILNLVYLLVVIMYMLDNQWFMTSLILS